MLGVMTRSEKATPKTVEIATPTIEEWTGLTLIKSPNETIGVGSIESNGGFFSTMKFFQENEYRPPTLSESFEHLNKNLLLAAMAHGKTFWIAGDNGPMSAEDAIKIGKKRRYAYQCYAFPSKLDTTQILRTTDGRISIPTVRVLPVHNRESLSKSASLVWGIKLRE